MCLPNVNHRVDVWTVTMLHLWPRLEHISVESKTQSNRERTRLSHVTSFFRTQIPYEGKTNSKRDNKRVFPHFHDQARQTLNLVADVLNHTVSTDLVLTVLRVLFAKYKYVPVGKVTNK